MGLEKIAFNFMVERGGKLAKSLLCSKPQKITNIKGLRYCSEVKTDKLTVNNPFINYIKKHFGRYINVAEVPRRAEFDEQLLELPEKYRGGFGSLSSSDASTYAMEITRKERAIELAKTNPIVAKNLANKPYLVEFSEEELISKEILDKAFKKVEPLKANCMEYRGVMLQTNNPFYKQISKLKKGDIYTEPGYIWTSPDEIYAHGRYSAKTIVEDIAANQASIRYHMLMPEGSRMLCVDRANPETLIKGSFKVCDVIKKDNDIDLFVEHILN
ncbi:hypothetical protein IKU74_03070 [bacterium]|nr:hypothetical protein [bacterium]